MRPADLSDVIIDVGAWSAGVVSDVGGAVDTVKGVADFASDPLGAIVESLRKGADGLVSDLLPALFAATTPDLTVDWFIAAYSLSFAIGIIVWGFLLLFQTLGVARGKTSGAVFFNTLLTRSGLYFGGVLFGPIVAMMTTRAVDGLTKSLVTWGVTGTFKETALDLGQLLTEDKLAAVAGGVMIELWLLFFMVIGLLIVIFMQIILLVTLYMSGALIPIGLVWIVSRKHETFGLKLVYVWFGLLLSQPLLVFVLGIAFRFIGSSIDQLDGDTNAATVTIQLIAAIIALALAGFAPMALLKFAPVIPKGGQGSDGPEPSGGHIGAQSLNEANNSFRSASHSEAGASNTNESSQNSSTAESTQQSSGEGGGSDGPLVAQHKALNSSRESSQNPALESAGGTSTGGSGGAAGGAAGGGGSEQAQGGGELVGAGVGAGSSTPGTSASAGAAGGGASAAGTAGTAAGGAATGGTLLAARALMKGTEGVKSSGHRATDAMDANATDIPDYRPSDEDE